MFRPMRRHRQQLSQGDCAAILSRGTSGVLAVAGDGGYPYAVPLSYVYQEGTLFFHCAKAGHKLDALRRCSKASFCVIDQDQVVPPEYTTYFRSVIAFGQVWELTVAEEQLPDVAQYGTVCGVSRQQEGILVRLLSAAKPPLPCAPARPDLEDVYLFHFGEGAAL